MRDLRGAVAEFQHEVGDDLVQHADCLGKWFVWEARMRAGVAVGKKQQANYEDG